LPGVKAKSKTPEANSEATQPVFSNTTVGNVAKMAEKNLWGRMVGSLAIVLVLFSAALMVYRKWPGSKTISQRAKMIEVLSQHYMGPKRSLAVIRVAGEAVLIGLTDSNITFLKSLSLLDEDVPQETRQPQSKFKSALGARVKDQATSKEDDFSMQGLKEIIGDRLKNMREL